ncbi:preprotein translocase subunit SecD [Clostridium minihomine]|uniref:preprotein translocase subunit SecD n=1 Tax=Clostridium minihomine TaxID=2045012 RepID=UPI000C7714F4|nr:SecD/SecF family protein translocase subunit [Clostridium minihomine]
MKRIGKPVFFIVALLILFLTYTSIFGVYVQNGDIRTTYVKGAGDIRWGVDIRGGVEATFTPETGQHATETQLAAAKSTIELRLVKNNITDYEIYTDDNNDRIIVRFPWKSDEKDFDPEQAIQELSATALLTFREGAEYETTETGSNGEPVYKTPKGVTKDTIILQGSEVVSAQPQMYQDEKTGKTKYLVALEMSDEGAEKFAEATERLLNGSISVWMDDVMISAPTVNQVISDGKCTIEGNFTATEASDLAAKISAGALPFKLVTTNFQTISPSLGESSLDAMRLAGIIAFALVAIFMLVMFRLPGCIAVIALLGQVAVSFAAISGYFPFLNSFTMTLPGVAGIILSIGMGVDANIITATRIKEELWAGKTLDGAIQKGNANSFWAIFDGNITVIIVAVILMGVFGPSNILSALFGPSTTGSIYSFGYTLLIGTIGNFIMGVTATRLMTKSISGFKFARSKWLYGGAAK